MSNITTSINIIHQATGVAFAVSGIRAAVESGMSSVPINLTLAGGEETVSFGDFISPRRVGFRLLEGDDVQVGVASGVYPLRLSGVDDHMSLRLDVEGRREISTITAGADTAGSLAGDHFDLTDRNGTVRVWFNTTERPEISTVQTVADVTDSLDGTYFLIYDDVGSVEVWINTSGGAATAPGVGARAIEVAITTDDTADAVAAAIQAAVDADAKFSASVLTDTVTITDASNGARTDIAAGTSGFAVAVIQQGITSDAPSPPGTGRLLQVDFTAGDTATTIAGLLQAALDADSEFNATVAGAVVTCTDQHIGTRADIMDGTTGWSLAVAQQGAAAPPVYLLSAGSSRLIVAVEPN